MAAVRSASPACYNVYNPVKCGILRILRQIPVSKADQNKLATEWVALNLDGHCK